MAPDADARLPGSFRDPSGFVFRREGTLYRRVNRVYKENYEALMGSGLYDELIRDGLLVPHQEQADRDAPDPEAFRVIRPQELPFVSYPYEWCFGQLKDAALLTLRVQRTALRHGMSLKDASAYNIQFLGERPLLIDTLSFERYQEGRPWVAYRQFCQHFLVPLALMSRRDVRLGQLLRIHMDGIPLDLGSRLLPWSGWFSLPALLHIHLHAASQRYFSRKGAGTARATRRLDRAGLSRLLEHLESAVSGFGWEPRATQWSGYYRDASSYTPESFESKLRIVSACLESSRPETVWDMGANTGAFSRVAARAGARVVAFDSDFGAVEECYRRCRRERGGRILPLVLDAANPTAAAGWANSERSSLLERGPCDVVLALALTHHLAIMNNAPFSMQAELFHRIGGALIVEFIPKEDPQARRLLSSREGAFPGYTREGFEAAFSALFRTERAMDVGSGGRRLYLMRRR